MGGAAEAGIAPMPWVLGRPLHRGRRGSSPMPRAARGRGSCGSPLVQRAAGLLVPWLAVRGATGATGAAAPHRCRGRHGSAEDMGGVVCWTPTSPPRAALSGRTRLAPSGHGKICAPFMIRGPWTGKGPLRGKIFARCIPRRLFAGLFGYITRISCQNQLISDTWRRNVATNRRFSRPRLLRERMGRKNCHG